MKYSGIPLASAVVVLHDPAGAQPIVSSGGGLSGAASHRLDYDGRQGKWEDRGGCVREATDLDMRARSQAFLDAGAGRSLDYVSRMYGFEEKGADRMTDATFWGQHGPLSREQVEEEMLRCGGTFVKSVVSVDRRYAFALGLDSKESFERLMREKWADSVMRWGVAARPEDIRWVANYHDDAEHSLHVHVTTFFAGDSPECGWTVTAAATRAAKQEIYRSAYRLPMLERDMQQDYLRNLIPAIARVEMGVELDREALERLERKGAELGVVPALERTVEGRARDLLNSSVGGMREEYAAGSGRLSSNWRLMAEARAVCDRLYKESVPYREAVDAYRSAVERKADAAGLAVQKPHDPDLRETARSVHRVVEHERNRFIAGEMDEMKGRVARALVRECVPEARRDAALRDELRGATRGVIASSMRMHGDNPLGLPREQAVSIARDLRDPSDMRKVDAAVRAISDSPAMREAVDRAVTRVQSDPSVRAAVDPESVRAAAMEQVRAQLSRSVAFAARSGYLDPDRAAARGLADAIARERGMSMLDAATRDSGIRLGLSRSEHAALMADVAEARRGTGEDGSRDARAQEAFDRAVRTVASSPAVTRAINAHAMAFSDDGKTPDQQARNGAERAVKASVERQLEQRCKTTAPHAQSHQMPEPDHQMQAAGVDLASVIASTAARSAMRTAVATGTGARTMRNEQAYSEERGGRNG